LMNKIEKELAVEIQQLEFDLKIKEAREDCTCRDEQLHYHVLVSDAGTGNEYIAYTEEEHKNNVKELTKKLKELNERLKGGNDNKLD
jgi:hypothetical protein